MSKAKPTEEEKTLLQLAFEGKQILTSRPPDMDYESYRFLKRFQDKMIKKLLFKPSNTKIQQHMR